MALTFCEYNPGDVTAYDHRGEYQGYIAPVHSGFEVRRIKRDITRSYHLIVRTFPTLDDAKHAFVAEATCVS